MITNAVSAAVSFFARTSANRIRATGSYVDGRWTRVVESETPIKIHHQPVSGEDLERLPEGSRTSAMKSVWTRSDLRSAVQHEGIEADVLVFAGDQWEVVMLHDRQEYGSYTKAIVSRSDVV